MDEIATESLGIVTLAAVVGAFVGVGRWVVVPIDRAAKMHKAPVRFSMGDFLCLFLAIQIPLAAIYALVQEEERVHYWLFTVVTWIVAPFIWYICTQALSKAGVSRGGHRIVFLGLVLPVVYYGLFPFALLPVAGLRALIERDAVPPTTVRRLVACWIGLAVLLTLSGLYTRWLVRQVETEGSREDRAEESAFGE